MPVRIVRVSASPLLILSLLERARLALDDGQPAAGRALLADAIGRLASAKAAQDLVLDEAARTLERPGAMEEA
jgi:hypothetical protein